MNKALHALAREVADIDACLTAATLGRGVDGNGKALRGLDERVLGALDRLVRAGMAAHKLRGLTPFQNLDAEAQSERNPSQQNETSDRL